MAVYRVYKDGWNRKGERIAKEELAKVAKSFIGKTHLYQHDPNQRLGKIRNSWEEDGSILQEFDLNEEGEERYKGGGNPEFSIRVQAGPESQALCSICGVDVVNPAYAIDCTHKWNRGSKLADGREIYLTLTGTEGCETSLCVGPAVPGTGIAYADNEATGSWVDERIRLAELEGKEKRMGKEIEGQGPTESQTQLLAASETLTEAQTQLAQALQELEFLRAEKAEINARAYVQSVLAEGKWTGPIDTLVSHYRENPALVERILAGVPSNPAMVPGTRLAQVPDIPGPELGVEVTPETVRAYATEHGVDEVKAAIQLENQRRKKIKGGE